MISHLLNRRLAHWRRVETATGTGGTESTWERQGDVTARVSQPGAAERIAAAQAEAQLTHAVYLDPASPVARGDELRDGVEVYEVTAVVAPSEAAYRRADCHLTQHEGA